MRNIIIIIIIFVIFYLLLCLVNNNLKFKSVTYENFENNIIPKIIIQTWKTNIIPKKYKSDIQSIKKFNPDYQYLFFTDEDIEFFLKKFYPDYHKSYSKLPVKIQQIDYFRYIAIYHYGGFYFDLDMSCFKSLDPLLYYDSVFPVDQNLSEYSCKRKRIRTICKDGLPQVKFLVGQYAFGAKPKNEFIKKLIDTIHNNVDEYITRYEHDKTHNFVYSTTGPDFVTYCYLEYNKKEDVHMLLYDKDQYFGDYGKHNHYGTWK